MRRLSIAESLREGIAEEMRRDPSVFCMGEDIAVQGGWGGAFTVTLGALTSVPSGVTVLAQGITAFEPVPGGSGYQGLFSGSAQSPTNYGTLWIEGIPAGKWFVTCNAGSGDFSVQIGGGGKETISATSSGLTFAAVFPSGKGSLIITNPQGFLWQSCSFEPVSG